VQVYSIAFSSEGTSLAAANDDTSFTLLPSIIADDSTAQLAASLV
jgi:hypothetical protein